MRKPESFGDYITIMREQRGLSGRQLAKSVGVANSTIVDIENGTTPKIELFVKLVDALELDATLATSFLAPYRRLYQQITNAQEGRNDDRERTTRE